MSAVMLDVQATELDSEEKDILQHPLVGGVILFSRNFYDRAQLCELVRQLREAAHQDIVIAVDHEGGRVQRFRQDFTLLPAAGDILNYARKHQTDAETLAADMAWLMATELLCCDIDISFAPVLDINNISDVIGDRGFAEDAQSVTRLASAYAKGMRRAGMATTGKHFPGHGSVKEDSHIAMPVDNRSFAEITAVDLPPFKQLIQQNMLDAIMPAHVIYPDVDDQPAGFSQVWLQQILRQQLGFAGTIFSDDLGMAGAGAAGGFADRARAALDAGCDVALVCNDRRGAIAVLDGLDTQIAPQYSRLASMRHKTQFSFTELVKHTNWQDAVSKANKIREQKQ